MAAIPPRSASARRSASTTSRARPIASPSPASPPRKRRSPSRRSRRRRDRGASPLTPTLSRKGRGSSPRACRISPDPMTASPLTALALAAALARLEQAPEAEATLALLDAAYGSPRAHVVGVTGPPGVGKSTLIGALISAWRRAGETVGVVAVDPSSRVSGGALLGDRTRLRTDPEDEGVFVRSMAARDKLGGLAALTVSAMVLMRALYDKVIIETVGVGQSETDVAG